MPARRKADLRSISSIATVLEALGRTFSKTTRRQTLDRLFAESARSAGQENIGPERTLPGRHFVAAFFGGHHEAFRLWRCERRRRSGA